VAGLPIEKTMHEKYGKLRFFTFETRFQTIQFPLMKPSDDPNRFRWQSGTPHIRLARPTSKLK
jgi:hypothetical protein